MLAQTISVARAVLFNRLGELLTRMRPQLGGRGNRHLEYDLEYVVSGTRR
jgi:hypothetical protein